MFYVVLLVAIAETNAFTKVLAAEFQAPNTLASNNKLSLLIDFRALSSLIARRPTATYQML